MPTKNISKSIPHCKKKVLNLTQVVLIKRLHEEYVFDGTQIVFHGARFFRVTSESTLIFCSAHRELSLF